MKKIWALIIFITTTVLSGLALSRFLKWACKQEIFDFDLNEDIDYEELDKI
jgi:hypothetical protein